MKNTTHRTRGFTLIELLVVISIIGVLAGLSIGVFPKVRQIVNRVKRNDNMKQLHILMMMYANDWNSFPTTQPPATRYEKGGGVKDLYPLYSTGLLEKGNLVILQPPGAALAPFSSDPGPEEFNKNSIGVAYNSTCIPDDPDNPPLLADQGVSSGSLRANVNDRGIKSIDPRGAVVLFASGQIDFINADRNGKLSTSRVSADQWGRLLD